MNGDFFTMQKTNTCLRTHFPHILQNLIEHNKRIRQFQSEFHLKTFRKLPYITHRALRKFPRKITDNEPTCHNGRPGILVYRRTESSTEDQRRGGPVSWPNWNEMTTFSRKRPFYICKKSARLCGARSHTFAHLRICGRFIFTHSRSRVNVIP